MKNKLFSVLSDTATAVVSFLKKFWNLILSNKTASAIIAGLLCLCVVLSIVFAMPKKPVEILDNSSQEIESSSEVETSTPAENSSAVSSVVSASSVTDVSSSKPVASKKPETPVTTPVFSGGNGDFKYNTNLNIDDNVFLDSLIYTGYNLNKHRADGLMWQYVLASQKRGKGWLSKIGYAGGSTGYETNSAGKPDIAKFERGGLVCASYVTYVYFNYLPNVAGIDTSSLTKPVKPTSAHDWYIAAKDWIKKGYSQSIPFTASKTSSGFIKFNSKYDIPIGSVVVFRDAKKNLDHGSHVAIYAGYKNGYNWIYHVGNENGPEFCAIERVLFGPDPQWPIMVISTPSNIRFSASLEIELKDDGGKALFDVPFIIKHTKTGKETAVGKTDKTGKIVVDGLLYGEYSVIQQSVPNGYTTLTTTNKITLTPQNNSYNRISLKNNSVPVVSSSQPVSPSSSGMVSSNENHSSTIESSDVSSIVQESSEALSQ